VNKILWDMEMFRSSHVPEVHREAHCQKTLPNPVFSAPGWQVAPNERLTLARLDTSVSYDLANGKLEFVSS